MMQRDYGLYCCTDIIVKRYNEIKGRMLIRKLVMSQIKAMAEDIQPLLAEVHDSGLLKEVENLTKSITQASEDLRRVHSSVMTPENTELIQKSIYTPIFTLKNFEVGCLRNASILILHFFYSFILYLFILMAAGNCFLLMSLNICRV
ncbi:protein TRIGALACTOSYLDIACYLGLYCEROL 2, chloroplastic-like [Olea europaea var. sylvestris]|uniref:protein TRIGALACTOSYLDIACYLGLYCEROL 2, chloroplastic-like n=1 Tax=Olea europaea var. sylvestris TaxID=158386 RepID=UPI000C1D0CC6|nr:protein TRIGALACTOSYLDIACYLGLYCEROL 2, chloroplastic-like [Olea europaea var. sylvestris]